MTNAIQFIRENGVEKAREVVSSAPELAEYYSTIDGEYYRIELHAVNLRHLKRLVDSVDLIGKYHSIDHAKNHYNNMREALNQYQYESKDIEDLSNELKQAIADYESIYGGEHV